MDLEQIAVVGGGRWGQIHAKTLAKMPRVGKVFLISTRNTENVSSWLKHDDSWDDSNRDKVLVLNSVSAAIRNDNIESFVVANLPAEHYSLARYLLEHNKHVLVEKPFTLKFSEAMDLIRLAESKSKSRFFMFFSIEASSFWYIIINSFFKL